jgi:hypothetical protein
MRCAYNWQRFDRGEGTNSVCFERNARRLE